MGLPHLPPLVCRCPPPPLTSLPRVCLRRTCSTWTAGRRGRGVWGGIIMVGQGGEYGGVSPWGWEGSMGGVTLGLGGDRGVWGSIGAGGASSSWGHHHHGGIIIMGASSWGHHHLVGLVGRGGRNGGNNNKKCEGPCSPLQASLAHHQSPPS